MAAPAPLRDFIIFSFFGLLSLLVSVGARPVFAEQTANLSCPCLDVKRTIAMKITRSGLSGEDYVILVRDKIPDPTHQSPEYSGRVNCSEGGTCSIHNVTRSDEAEYTCHVYSKGLDPDGDPKEDLCSMYLRVTGGQEDLSDLAKTIIGVFSVLGVIAVIVPVIVYINMKRKEKVMQTQQSDDDDDDNSSYDNNGGALLHSKLVGFLRRGQQETVQFHAVSTEEPFEDRAPA